MDSDIQNLRVGYQGKWSDDHMVLGEKLLADAESLYGKRDRTWTFLGVRLEEPKGNLTWPIDKKRKLACICLAKLSPDDWPDLLLFNLAHETVHMLSPPDWDQVTYLEEGVAVVFSLTRRIYSNDAYLREQQKVLEGDYGGKYTIAWRDVCQLIKADPNVIAKLRCKNKSLSAISAAQIIETAPTCDSAVAERLSRKFNV